MSKKKSLLKIAGVFITLPIAVLLMTVISSVTINSLFDTGLQIEEFFIQENLGNTFVFVSLMLGQYLGFITTYGFFVKVIQPINEKISFRKKDLFSIIKGTILVFIIYLSISFISSILLSSDTTEGASNIINTILSDTTDPTMLIFIFIVVGILAPITEEMIFRGLIQEYLIRGFEVPVAIIITSFLFGLLHFGSPSGGKIASSILYIFITFSLSLVLGHYKEKTNNLLVPILIHGIYNSILIIVTILFIL